ncbi:MAG TPA: OmpA family protein [Bacteroidetes bacterium]|nr:OmpA family protein [Bacteroidota bacterium]
MRSLHYFFLLLLCSFSFSVLAQEEEPLYLKNPSFEGTPAEGSLNGIMLPGWYDCGFPGETIPDVHPKQNSAFGVTTKPFHGNTYIGMVVRDNETWERISQRLSRPLKAGQCYEFSISLARSLNYQSTSKASGQEVNFATPAKLRIWGGNSICDRGELLDESDLVINSRWLINEFRFKPRGNFHYIIFEAFYKTPSPFPYNGNILMDNASPIVPVPCEEEIPVVEVAEVPTPVPESNNEAPPSTPPPPVATEPNQPDRILEELDRSKISKGTTIQIDQLFFKSDSFAITPPSYPVLDEIYHFLQANPDVRVEIGGHTNNIPTHEYCDNLSTKRAKAVADYLIGKGISRSRIQYRGYGKRKPLVSNSTRAGRKKNQRVEIKILSFDG